MYFGSVKFFKHLILTVVFGWIIIATGLALFFGIKYFLYSKDLKQDSGEATGNVLNIPDNMPFEQIYLLLCAKGYSPDDIISFLADNEPVAFENFINNYILLSPDDSSDIEDNGGSELLNTDTSLEYTKLYPELYANPPSEFVTPENVVYLTFDDGPSKNTKEILRILKKYDIKATFFMSGGYDENTAEMIKLVSDAGHTIGVHSLSHKYTEVYESMESFLEDFNNTYMSIYEATGVKPQLYRFPGGSVNNYNRFISAQLISEVVRRGFVYHDWNVSGEDAASGANWSSIYNNVINGIKSNSSGRAVILLHDSSDKYTTVTTLEDIIDKLLAEGYTFEPLDNTVKPFTFSYTE